MGGLEGTAPGVPGRGQQRGGAARKNAGAPEGRRDAGALIDAVFPDTGSNDGGESSSDLQSVLATGVRDVVRRTAARQVGAWIGRLGDGAPVLAALHQKQGDPPKLTPEQFEALRRLRRATDLGEPRIDPCLTALAQETGLAAAAPLYHSDAEPDGSDPELAMGALLLGGPEEPPGRVRPRTLAMLGEVAAKLRGPLSTVHALARIDELDDEIGRLDRLAALGDLLTEIVHEVRNPLVSVKTFLQLLPERLDDPDFHRDFRLVVSDEVARLERLLDSVLRHGAPRENGPADDTASVRETFETVSNLIGHRARERGIGLERPDDEAALQVAIAADALRQVVLNLTLNALDATSSGGVVRLRARASAAADGRWVEIAVEDEGEGISGDARARIFEPFYSTRSDRPGGLGLAISKRLVEEAGGHIAVDSSPTGGARFAIRLPAARTP